MLYHHLTSCQWFFCAMSKRYDRVKQSQKAGLPSEARKLSDCPPYYEDHIWDNSPATYEGTSTPGHQLNVTFDEKRPHKASYCCPMSLLAQKSSCCGQHYGVSAIQRAACDEINRHPAGKVLLVTANSRPGGTGRFSVPLTQAPN